MKCNHCKKVLIIKCYRCGESIDLGKPMFDYARRCDECCALFCFECADEELNETGKCCTKQEADLG